MTNQVIGVTIKGIGDFSDVVSNVGSVQKALTKLKVPEKLGTNLNKNIENFYKEYEKYQKKIAEGIHTQGDQNAVNKSLNSMLNSYEKIVNEFGKLSKKDFKDIFNLDDSAFASVQKRIKEIQAEIKKIKIDPKQLTAPMDEIKNMTKAKAVSGSGKGLDKIQMGVDNNDILLMKEGLQELITYYDRFSSKMSEQKRLGMAEEIEKLKTPIENAISASDRLEQEARELDRQFEDIGSGASRELDDVADALDKTKVGAGKVTEELKKIHNEEFSFNREAQNIDRQIQSYFGLSQMIRKVGDIAKDAFATVKELDAAMTQTAVVTNFSVGDMWEMLPTYTEQANQLGSTIKDVYDAATLYYQQGLNTNQAMGLANETLKMARIAGLDAAEATNMMTAALRGFNMEINQASAQKINDVYSELAAITASDTQEIGSAMERTASIANSANMEFETTSAFLAQMIETTREAPENLGTAMKTIVARFQEMKQDPTKLVDSEGVAMDANKVDKALKTIGVDLMNTKGEFRDLDDVFLDISAKWDSLTQGQQRYIATIAAGSRQQSRFIAMMSNYERTMELVDAANNSAGASQRQFEKTLESMDSKLNKLKNAWDQFTMGLMNNQILKFGVDALTDIFTIVNKIIDVLGSIPAKPFEGITKSALTLVTTLGMLQLGKRGSRGLVMGAASWWQKGKLDAEGNPMEGGFLKGFSQGWGGSKNNAGIAKAMASINTDSIAYKKGQTFALKFKTGFKSGKVGQGIEQEVNNLHIVPKKSLSDGYAKLIEQQAFSPERKKELQDGMAQIFADVKSGKLSSNKIEFAAQSRLGLDTSQLDPALKKVDALSMGFGSLGVSIANAGSFLTEFGAGLGGPVGNALMTVGSLLSTVGSSLALFATESVFATAATEALGTASWFSLAGIKALGAGVQALWAKFLASPLAPIIAAMAAIAGIAYGIYRVATADKRALESANDAAAAASDAYDSVKQETSELADSIAQIEETDSVFDNLVAGTAEFNEQLVTANEQITELLDKYPMLNDPKYLSTDKNGRMRINQAGLDAVKEYQKQIQANASAMNLIQTADLNALENQQKVDDLRKIKTGTTAEEAQKNARDADLLEQRIEAETALARQNAIRVSLADKELHSAETMSKIMADQYETKRESAEIDVNAMDKHERRQAYADFHGYTYEKATKKIKDIEGNEVDYDDNVIKDEVIEQQVILEFQEDAESLERALSSANSKFAEGLEEQTAGSAHVISDILSSNIDTDEEILRKVLSEPNQLQDVVDKLSETEMAAILGISASSIDDSNIDKYRDEIVDKLTDKAINIAEAQAESYAELGAMMAKAQGNILDKNGNLVGQKGQTSKDIEKSISQQIDNLKPEYAHLMSSVGSQLQEFAGEDTMSAFVNAAYDIYNAQGEEAGKTINELNNLIEDTNFDSAISRLTFYNKAMKSSNTEIQNVAKSMKETTGEANLLGEAFDEFLGSSDWAEVAENADDFKNTLGEYDAAGIQEAAEQSRTLKELLDSGAISAGGVAAALQGMDDGTITNLNSTVLTLLSSFNRLADAASEAHKIIEGFDPGIDTGEGEEFVTENAEKFKEYYDNGEFGNEQLQNYIKLAAGTDEWNKALRRNKGDLRETARELKHYVTAFDEGFVSVYDKLTQGLDLKGNKISDKVKKEFEGLEFLWDENDELQINLADFGTEDLQLYLQKALGISEEYAKLMLQNLSNYDAKLSSDLRANDIKKSLKDKDFQDSHTDSQGKFILSDSDIRAVGANLELERDINTKEGLEEATKAIEKLAGTEIEVFRALNEDGSEREDYNQLLADYAKAFYSTEGKDLLGIKDLQQNGTFDIGKLISDGLAKGAFASQNQADQAAYEAIQQAKSEGIQELLYNGQALDLSEITSMDEFLAATQKLTDSAQWYEVGQSIAEGIISYIDSKENPNKPKNEDKGTDNSSKGDSGEKGSKKSEVLSGEAPNWAQTSRDTNTKSSSDKDILARISQWLSTNPATGEVKDTSTTTETPATFTNEGQESLSVAATTLSDAATQLTTGTESLSTAGESLNTAATNLTNAAAILVTGNQSGNGKDTTITQPSNNQTPQPAESSISGAIVIDNSAAMQAMDDIKAKAEETKSTIEAGAAFKIDVSGGIKKLTKAASAAQKITKNSGDKSINIKANTSGTDQTNKLTTAVKDFRKLGNKTVKLKSDTSGLVGTVALTSAVKAFHRLTDKTITLTTVKKTKTEPGEATGARNHGYFPAPPKAGSVARGSYGQVGPKGKGGLTLTGELGYEIAWIPSENRSMILGANGPQMVNLPGDAVVWTHEQSKKIMKQNAIPAGSHANTTIKRPGSSGDKNKGKDKGKDKGKGKGNNKDKGNKTQEKIIQKAGKVLVWWENVARRMDKAQRDGELAQKQLANLLKIFGTTVNQYKKTGEAYLTALKSQENIANDKISRAKSELAMTDFGRSQVDTKKVNKARNKYQKAKNAYDQNKTKANKKKLDKAKKSYNKKANAELEAVGARQEISYDVTKKTREKKNGKWGKWKKTKETKTSKVNLANYIKNVDGVYEINQEAINKIAKTNKSKAEAIKQAAEKQLSDLLRKQQEAEDERIKAQEAREQFYNDVYDTFSQWDKAITTVYLLGQQLEKLSGLRNIYESIEDLEFSKIEAGFGKAIDRFPKIAEILKNNVNTMVSQVQTNFALVDAARNEYDDWLNGYTATIENAKYGATSTTAKSDYEANVAARNFLAQIGQGNNFDYNKAITAVTDLYKKGLEKEDYNKIKEGLDKIAEKQNAYYDALADTYSSMTEIYKTIEEYQSYMSDFEDSLIKGIEEQTQKEIDRLDKLSNVIDKAAKDLIEQVKRKLDERRKQEDNAKTEQDISQKQQRLAALRADTSGGHQVEIAQLEKEIADSQQSYQRNLEDQLLDRLSDQADKAAEQREHQISLLEAQKDLDEALGTNVEEINKWLKDPNKYYEQIRSAWLENNNYSQVADKEKKQLEEAFEAAWAHYMAYQDVLPTLEEIAKESNLPIETPKNVPTTVDEINNKMDIIIKNLGSEKVGQTVLTAAQMRGLNFTTSQAAAQLKNQGKALNANTLKEMTNAGYINYRELKAAGFNANAFGGAGISYNAARTAGFTAEQLKGVSQYASAANDEIARVEAAKQAAIKANASNSYNAFLNNHKNSNSTINKQGFTNMMDWGRILGYDNKRVILDLVNTNGLTWEKVIRAAKDYGMTLAQLKTVRNQLTQNQSKANMGVAVNKVYDPTPKWITNPKKFATGGLADFTGPAWLDGTPSKPELVLNAKDTQNFIALRDVLSRAMSSTGAVENTYGGDAMYEININVDKIEKDYDVDRVIEKVKKEITKGAGYRNVTQVRNFR